MIVNHGELNNKERNKESTARGGMTKMVRLFRTKKLKLELLKGEVKVLVLLCRVKNRSLEIGFFDTFSGRTRP